MRSVLAAGFIFWGLFGIFALIVLLYLGWMWWVERSEARRRPGRATGDPDAGPPEAEP
jgi:hypothetical protein